MRYLWLPLLLLACDAKVHLESKPATQECVQGDVKTLLALCTRACAPQAARYFFLQYPPGSIGKPMTCHCEEAPDHTMRSIDTDLPTEVAR